ncbi:MAG: carbon-nitrogen hydrolase family protein [Bdellovibrionales bacterium]|nr:carbon-nitrogen hydrolase family protein [Bdellovibrionales bacterium]
MRIAVCEAAADLRPGEGEWSFLIEQVAEAKPDILLLNELPFGPWFAAQPEPDPAVFDKAVELHQHGIDRLDELGVKAVLGSRPLMEGSDPVNQGFTWTEQNGIQKVHNKQFFPNEEGYYEARWFRRGTTDFKIADVLGIKTGFLICTEMMFNEYARHYGRSGAQLIVCPRATESATLYKWEHALALAAIVSGCYVASSNRNGADEFGLPFAGKGMIFDPFGHLVAETSDSDPIAVADLDLNLIEKAKVGWPCHAEDLPNAFSHLK